MASWLPSSIDAELICGLCQAQFRDPIYLPCGHTFCRGCLQHRHLGRPGPLLICPSCQRCVTLSRDGLRGLPVNHAHLRLLEKQRPSVRIPCLVCEAAPPRNAVKSCLQCKLSYCGPCLEQLHPNRGNLTDHSLTEPRLSLEHSDGDLCEVHGEKLSLYCFQCEKPSCLVCDRVGRHKNHRPLDIQTAYQHVQVEMRCKYNYLHSRLAKFRNDLKQMDHTLVTQQRATERFQEKVERAYGGMVRVIAERKSAMISQSRRKFDEFSSRVAVPALKLRLDRALQHSHKTERHASSSSVQLEDLCADIIDKGFYTITIADSRNRERSVTLRVRDGHLTNYAKFRSAHSLWSHTQLGYTAGTTQQIDPACRPHRLQFSPQRVLVRADFETAFYKAVDYVLPNAQMTGFFVIMLNAFGEMLRSTNFR